MSEDNTRRTAFGRTTRVYHTLIFSMGMAISLGSWGSCKDKQPPRPRGADAPVPGVLTAPPVEQEVEPNDRPDQATAILPDRLVEGRIRNPAKGRDIDHFLINNAHARGLLRVEVSGVPGLDLIVSVRRKTDKKPLAVAQNGGAGAAEIVPNLGVAPGDYLIVVREGGKRSSNVDAPYTLRASLAAAQPGDEAEPNDTRADAQEIEAGTPVTGYFGRRKDVDWFRFKLPENVPDSSLRVELTAIASVLGASFSVQDEIEVMLKKGFTRRGSGVLFPNIGIKAGQRFLYLVAGGGKRYSVADKYTLTTKLSPLKLGSEEREPNDRPPQASPLKSGSKQSGYIAPAGDEDWYALDVPAQSMARIAVTGIEQVDLVLSVHDASGTQKVLVDEGGVRDGEVIPNAWLAAGKALLRVSAKRGQENLFSTYELSAELRSINPADEREPNDTAAQANPLRLGETARGFIYPKRDVDVFRIEVPAIGPAPTPIRLELRGIPKVPLALVVRSAQGVIQAKVGPKPSEETLTLERSFAAGTYLVEVSGGGESNPRDMYELRATRP